ncbi:CLUMA_CG007992, isoform A [Clunio marinus]|uniref:CLUMA_CG007992, isoform A n=1 Tax=Clunio marinus TaxID=568069 RepID=A0A1J1I6C4_9DIPT|nr:CLUMA_CG007992, isoform A [Clunio marinus]
MQAMQIYVELFFPVDIMNARRKEKEENLNESCIVRCSMTMAQGKLMLFPYLLEHFLTLSI